MNDAEAKSVYINLVLPRPPYVQKGKSVDYVGRIPSSASFIGGRIVRLVMPWAGRWYPVLLRSEPGDDCDLYPDTDLSVLYEEVPAGFWSMKISRGFKNVHAYVRKKRQLARRRFVRRMHRVLRHDRPKSQVAGVGASQAADMAICASESQSPLRATVASAYDALELEVRRLRWWLHFVQITAGSLGLGVILGWLVPAVIKAW